MTQNNIEKSMWMDMVNIAYSTRRTILPHERKITIEVSEDCLDNLAGLLGLIPKYNVEETTPGFSSQYIQKQLVDGIKLQEYVMGADVMPWMCGNLSIQIVGGVGIFDIRFR